MRPQSTQYGLPLILEDLSGQVNKPTAYTDLYDRLRITCTPSSSSKDLLQLSFKLGSNGRAGADAVIDIPLKKFEGATISYAGGATPIPVEAYLRKVKGLSSRSPCRRFTASDSHSYTWSLVQSNPKDKSTQAWTCTQADSSAVVAEYTVNDSNVTGSTSAAVLTVEEHCSGIVLELLTTLTLVRHIAANKL
ncbi:hypothetical protein FS837_012077 [Tulasnella sp. UAMH 9824]|nr:hypothetical protein FS837_012077 [Tulasnella sp. UAMH 9824]